ncbi:hypothetical protein [Streptomyces sp. KLOTTS4A1]|uniref:hypothetical protein n=1 Tax=Streptomyces sp. KLOTTS4A1 TaxID=3390996 RepID=UPI0039F5DDCD
MAKHLRAWSAVAATTAAAAAIVAVPGSAQAGNYTVNNCPSGYVCAYNGSNLSRTIVSKSSGSWTGTGYQIKSLFNNGKAYAGADHIRYTGTIYYTDGSFANVTGCLHYNTGSSSPSSGSYVNFPGEATKISTAKWGGECNSNEPVRKIGPRFYP